MPETTVLPGEKLLLPETSPLPVVEEAPLPEEEIQLIMSQVKGESARPKPKFSFEKGEDVRVIEGPFINFNGVVEEVNEDKGKVKVMVSIFGRSTPVELEFPQIELV